MQEEFHGDTTGKRKLLYGWNTLTANVWLPSLSELVGIDPDHYDDGRGCYNSAMQGLNISADPHVMQQGGAQWTYLSMYNASGGGPLLWSLGGEEEFWMRSLDYAQNHAVVLFQNDSVVRYICLVTASHAVRRCKFHISSGQIPYRSQWL